jgi:isoleucyl-tRNA synthetase
LLESDGFKQSIIKFNDYICREILADNIEWVSALPDGVEIDINETLLKLAVTKKG